MEKLLAFLMLIVFIAMLLEISFGAAFIVVLLGGAFFLINSLKIDSKKVEEHKKNLIKGGIIPRQDRDVHNEALRQLSKEHPGLQLPKSRYFDE